MIEMRRMMEEGHARIYAMSIHLDLFDRRPTLEVAHGREGWKPKKRRETFDGWEALFRRVRILLKRRDAHGYRVVLGARESLFRVPL